MLKPIKVVDIELSNPLTDLECLGNYEFVKAVVRLHGTPIGYVKVPVSTDSCIARILK